MNESVNELIERLSVKDNKVRKEALDKVIELTEEEVNWIYEYWDILVKKLDSENSYQRTIGMFVLSNLAKSDSENRFEGILDKYLMMAEDEKFITSRQTLQTVWKVAVTKENCRARIIEYLTSTFTDNKHLVTHANLIRKDVVESLCRIYETDTDLVDLNYLEMQIEENCEKKEQKILKDIMKKVEKTG